MVSEVSLVFWIGGFRVVIEALKMDALQKLLAALEPLVRRVVSLVSLMEFVSIS